jgi:hypothetical protein
MFGILLTAIVIVLTLGAIAYVAERQQGARDNDAKPVYSLLPGDIKYESPDGRFKFYFPVTTSIILSVVLSLLMRLFS